MLQPCIQATFTDSLGPWWSQSRHRSCCYWFQYEKEKAEKSLKRAEGERDTVNTELIQAQVELSKVQSQSGDVAKQQAQLQEQLEDLQEEKERAGRAKQEVMPGSVPWVIVSPVCCA